MPPDEKLIAVWERFSKQVRHETRFVFFEVTTNLSEEIGDGTYQEPHQVLQSLGNLVRELDLITTLPVNARILRARQHFPKDKPKKVGEIAPLPPEKSRQQNRFSPAGIPMFYGAKNEKSAFLEIASAPEKAGDLISYGSFRTNRPLTLLDLTKLPPQASLFDPDRSCLRMPISFLNHFIFSASRPVDPDASSIEYVPTQVIAEYFRHLFLIHGDVRLDGILYESSKKGAGVCYTLFLGAENCGDSRDKERTLRLCSIKTFHFAVEEIKHSMLAEE